MLRAPIYAAALLLASTVAHADQRILVDSQLSANFSPASTTPMTGTGFWAVGTTDGLAALVRYDASGAPALIRFPVASYASSFKVVAMPDGGALMTDLEDSDVLGDQACRLRRFDAYGNLLWTRSGSLPFYGFNQICANVRVDGGGGIWLFDAGLPLLLVNADGSDGPQAGVGNDFPAQAVAVPDQVAVYIAGWSGDAYSPPGTTATVWKLGPQGVAWTSPAPAADTGSVFNDVVLSADGTLWAFGSKGTQLYGMHVDADGQRLWSGAFDTGVAPTLVALAARPSGGVFALHWEPTNLANHDPGSAPEISAFSAGGSRLWHETSGLALPASGDNAQFAFAASDDGDCLAAMTYHNASPMQSAYAFEQVRIDSDGNVQYLTPPQPRTLLSGIELHALPDDTSLSVTGIFERRARNGSILPSPITDAVTTAASFGQTDVMAADGSVFLLVTNPDAKSFGVLAYSNNGSPLWHTAIASTWDHNGLLAAQLVLRTDDVCVIGYLDGNEIVQCFARIDGTPAQQVVLASAVSDLSARTQAITTGNDELVVLYAASDGMHHALVDAQNNVLHDVAPLVAGETWGGATAQNQSGQSLVATGSQAIVKIAEDGSRAYAVAADLHVSFVALAPDGSAMLIDSAAPALERVDSAGQRMWQSPLSPGGAPRSPKFTDTDFYFTRVINFFYYPYEGAPAGAPLSRYSLSGGALQWEVTIPHLLGSSPRLAIEPGNDAMVAFSGWGDRTLVRKYAIADGSLLGSKFVPCEVDECAIYHGIVATDGTLRMVHDTTDFYAGSAFEITIMQNEFDKVFGNGFDP